MPRLRIFDGKSYLPLWRELSEGESLTVGRSPDCEVQVNLSRLSLRHFTLRAEAGQCRVEQEDAVNGVDLNGEQLLLLRRTELSPGDIVSAGEVAVEIDPPEGEVRNLELEAAIVANPDDSAPFQVWADWLLERGDALGERIARAVRGDEGFPRGWNGALEGESSAFKVALSWRFGLIDRVEIRSQCHLGAYRALVARVLTLRAARFMRSLVFELLGCATVPAVEAGQELDQLIAAGLPATLSSLQLGYGDQRGDLVIDANRAQRLPRLAGARVFRAAHQAKLEVLAPRPGEYPLVPGFTLRVIGDRLTSVWSAPLTPHEDEDLRFELEHGRWSMRVGRRAVHSVRVNGRRSQGSGLLEGDRITLGPHELRFALG